MSLHFFQHYLNWKWKFYSVLHLEVRPFCSVLCTFPTLSVSILNLQGSLQAMKWASVIVCIVVHSCNRGGQNCQKGKRVFSYWPAWKPEVPSAVHALCWYLCFLGRLSHIFLHIFTEEGPNPDDRRCCSVTLS